MSRYHGPANVISGGLAIPVDADLHAEHPANDLSSWRGTIQAAQGTKRAADFWAASGNRWGRLLLPDGRDAEFVTTRHSAGSFRMEIKGSGTEPF
jgi:hypothetical protein